MLIGLTPILAASSMISCVTLVTVDGTKHKNADDHITIRSSGSGGTTDGSNPGDDSTDHDLDGDRWQDRVPREPMWFINAGAGVRNSSVHPEDNAKGYAVWWRGERAVDEFIMRIRTGYDVGARWFFINRPMGTPGNTHVPGASWLTLDQNKRDNLPVQLTDALLDEFDEPVHVVWFIGSDMSDPREFAGWTPGRDDQFFQVGQNDTWEQLIGSRVTLGGWISTGASGIAIDHSSPLGEREHFIRLFEQLNQFPFNLAIYGEAFPLVFENGRAVRDQGNTPKLDQQAITSMPWIGTTSYIDDRWPENVQSDAFPLDEDSTRMFVWFSRSALQYGREDQRIQLVHSYMDRNLIPITHDPVMFREALNRLRSTESSNATTPEGPKYGQNRSTPGTNPDRIHSSDTQTQQLPKRYQPRVKGIR